ncbi:MAG TPA: PilZ domain-containing protein [Sandaracinaceae bacterium LLY-WYZ-13_1]|nr:PilZ domain-containing protein [Sandaracinaceae bacterium LLY-WYZ-13_1]
MASTVRVARDAAAGREERRRARRVSLPTTAALLQRGDMVGRFTVQNLSAGGALLTGAKDVHRTGPLRLLLELPSGEPLAVGAHVRRRAQIGNLVALAVAFRHLSQASEDRIQDAVLEVLDGRYRTEHPAVVVVDASEAARLELASRLHEMGFRVIPCAAPLTALQRLQDPEEQVRAVVVRDAPGARPGPELLEWLAETHEAVRPILVVEDPASDPAVVDAAITRCRPEHLGTVLA